MNALVPVFSGPETEGCPRWMKYTGDNMNPTIRPHDMVAVFPISRFDYDSIYVIDVLGRPCFYRCMHVGKGQIRVSSDNPVYTVLDVDSDTFNEMVLGIVVAIAKILDHVRLGLD